jgi:WD40 repeat protein
MTIMHIGDHIVGHTTTYEINAVIGLSSSRRLSVMYRAIDLITKEFVAIKHNQYIDVDIFRQEAHLLRQLRHAFLPKFREFIEESYKMVINQYIVMDFIDGHNLFEVFQKYHPGEEVVIKWMCDIINAVNYLHMNKVIHRDIKPENIIITPQGKAVLLDLGIAKDLVHGQSQRLGTPNYAPIEQYNGQGTDERSDIYSLGATLYFALIQRPPPDAIAREHGVNLQLPPRGVTRSPISNLAKAIIVRAMQMDRAHRYQTVIDLQTDLQRVLLAAKSRIARPYAPTMRLSQWSLRSPTLLVKRLGHPDPVQHVVWCPSLPANTLPTASSSLSLIVVTKMHVYAYTTDLSSAYPPLLVTEALSAAVSPNRKWLAVGQKDGSVKLWLVDGYRLYRQEQVCKGEVLSLDFDKSGTVLAAANHTSGVVLYHLARRATQSMLGMRAQAATCVTFSPSGWCAIGTLDGTIHLWSRNENERTLVHDAPLSSLAFSPDGRLLAAGSWDHNVLLWNIDSKQTQPTRLQGHQEWVTCVRFSRDGWKIATGSLDKTIRIWDMRTPNAQPVVLQHHQGVMSVSFSPDSQQEHLLAGGCLDGTVWIWNVI